MKIYTESVDFLFQNELVQLLTVENAYYGKVGNNTLVAIPKDERCIVIELSELYRPEFYAGFHFAMQNLPSVEEYGDYSDPWGMIVDFPADIVGKLDALPIPGTNYYIYTSKWVCAIFESHATHCSAALIPSKMARPRILTTLEPENTIRCHFRMLDNPSPRQINNPIMSIY